jgi:hypothetical protein
VADELSGDIYEKFIESTLEYEKARKVSLEQRGLSIVSSSGVLITLLFGIATLVRGKSELIAPLAPRVLLAAGLVAFLIAILLGLAVNQPLSKYYEPVPVQSLRRAVESSNWKLDAIEAARRVSERRVEEIDTWRDGNGRKAARLYVAGISQAVGVVFVAGAVLIIIF